MKIAAYQAPLLPSGSMQALALVGERVRWCEAQGVEFLCCPEAILGGLADYAGRPEDFALSAGNGQLEAMLAPLASDRVTTILGFTEISPTGRFFNSAAVFHQGAVAGVYRKVHPAIRKSIYHAGDLTPVFMVGGLKFGIVICNDSNFPALARSMAAQGATVLFVPSNCALLADKADVVEEARNVDIRCARENRMTVVRADVAGYEANLVAHGSSAIVAPDGRVLLTAPRFGEELLVVDLDLAE